ncbi:MAG: Gfo/Idh/MocA family protein [Planctomycetota bacterium]|jgi:predicted dehydrogenase
MAENKLKTAVLGLDESGIGLLRTASSIDKFEIEAVADKDTQFVEKVAGEYNCAGYDDYRQLIIQNQFDCLLVAAGLHSCDEYIKTAMKKNFNILKLSPPARNVEEAVEFIHLAEEANIKFSIANPCRFAKSFLTLHQFLQEERIEQVFLITAICSVSGMGRGTWQSDLKLAGGGVLLHDCYDIIDQLIWNFSMPQQVYSLNSNAAGDKQQRLYLTEDTSVVTMKFSDTLFGNIAASRRAALGAEQKLLKVYGKDKILTVSNDKFIVSDSSGQVSNETAYDNDQSARETVMLENFALSILSPDKNKLASSVDENLKNMVFIESAYLSARTSMPEEPDRILQMAQGEPLNIWSGRK